MYALLPSSATREMGKKKDGEGGKLEGKGRGEREVAGGGEGRALMRFFKERQRGEVLKWPQHLPAHSFQADSLPGLPLCPCHLGNQ